MELTRIFSFVCTSLTRSSTKPGKKSYFEPTNRFQKVGRLISRHPEYINWQHYESLANLIDSRYNDKEYMATIFFFYSVSFTNNVGPDFIIKYFAWTADWNSSVKYCYKTEFTSILNQFCSCGIKDLDGSTQIFPLNTTLGTQQCQICFESITLKCFNIFMAVYRNFNFNLRRQDVS